MKHISEALDGVLMGLGIDARTAGTGRSGNKRAGSSRNGARRQSAAGREEKRAAIRLVWSQSTAMRETPSQEGKPGASLMIVK